MNVIERRALGAAIQRGLMFATGYFADWSSVPYAPDWAVTAFGENSSGTWVEGLNMNCAPGEYGHRFRWYFSKREVALSDWRYRFELCPQAEGPLQ
jgi:hypothetical protein